MNQQRNTKTQIQGIVNMVFDVCDEIGYTPEARDFYTAIREWLDSGITPTSLSLGIKLYEEEKQQS